MMRILRLVGRSVDAARSDRAHPEHRRYHKRPNQTRVVYGGVVLSATLPELDSSMQQLALVNPLSWIEATGMVADKPALPARETIQDWFAAHPERNHLTQLHHWLERSRPEDLRMSAALLDIAWHQKKLGFKPLSEAPGSRPRFLRLLRNALDSAREDDMLSTRLFLQRATRLLCDIHAF